MVQTATAPARTRAALRALLAAFASLAVILIPLGSAHAAERLVLDHGHVDAFNVTAEGDELKLNLKEDVTDSHVTHAAEDVELHVKSAALKDLPKFVPGAPKAYYLPLTQEQNLLWPGWDTLETQGTGFDGSIKLKFDKVEGPGAIHLFGQVSQGRIEPLLAGGGTELKAGAIRDQSFPAHTHANWIFTKPGVYTLTLHAEGTKGGKKVSSNKATYTFTVGDEFKGKADAKAEKPAPAPAPKPEDSTTPKKPSDTEPTAEAPAPKDSTKPAAPANPAPADKPKPRTSTPKAKAPEKPAAPAPKAKAKAKAAAPAKEAKAPAKHAAPAAPAMPEAPAKEEPKAPVCTATEVVRDATQDEIKAATSTSKAKVGGSYTIPANTHVHPNWVFSKPGTYKLTIRQSVKGKDGKSYSDTSTLTFNVGSSSGATSGHFDFGSRFENGKLISSIKDDRKSPAQWVDPSSISFGLGNAAKAKAPAGIEFIAPAGSDVWMIGSTQAPSVPWVGANSMHPSIIQNTTGEITQTLVSASGPGNVGVFTSGNFGQIVGQKWYSSTAGSGSSVSAAKDRKSAEIGQIFKDGKGYKIVDLKGKTEDGADCDLSADQIVEAGGSADYAKSVTGDAPAGGSASDLPRTGAEVTGLAGTAAALIIVGAGTAVARRRFQ